MIELSTIRDIVAIASFIIALSYYILNIQNQRQTRQTQIFMNLYETYSSKEFRTNMTEIRSWEWETPDEFYEKYGERKYNPEAWNTFIRNVGRKLMKIGIELLGIPGKIIIEGQSSYAFNLIRSLLRLKSGHQFTLFYNSFMYNHTFNWYLCVFNFKASIIT